MTINKHDFKARFLLARAYVSKPYLAPNDLCNNEMMQFDIHGMHETKSCMNINFNLEGPEVVEICRESFCICSSQFMERLAFHNNEFETANWLIKSVLTEAAYALSWKEFIIFAKITLSSPNSFQMMMVIMMINTIMMIIVMIMIRIKFIVIMIILMWINPPSLFLDSCDPFY